MEDAGGYAARKLKALAWSFEGLSQAFSDDLQGSASLSSKEALAAMQMTATLVCGDCKNCELYEEDRSGQPEKVAELFEEKGSVYEEDMPEQFLMTCRRREEYLGQLNRNLGRASMNLLWKNRFLESREAIVEQFRELSVIMEEFSGRIEQTADITSAWREKVRRQFRRHRIRMHHMLLLEHNGREREAYVTLSVNGGKYMTTKDAARIFGEAMGSKAWMPDKEEKQVISKKPSMLRFVEEGRYMMLFGVARKTKSGEVISGDNYTYKEIFPRQVIVSLSDGMGSGEQAARESRKVIELMEQLLEAGFSAKTALKMVNAIFMLTGDEQHPATMDLCCVDLFSGVLEAMKLGAVATFLLSEDGVETLEAEDVPMGVLNPVEPTLLSKKLWNNTRIIMMSDGVLEAMPGEDKEASMREFLMHIPMRTPQDMAERILRFASAGEEARDDMTVLSAGIWKK
ncbi:MAG: SpoIIE family protein phosphatase [bacterium]|nr:SpoIIE family protein phosphatase [bacterium]